MMFSAVIFDFQSLEVTIICVLNVPCYEKSCFLHIYAKDISIDQLGCQAG